MLSGSGQSFLEQAPWIGGFPGIAITAVVLAVNLLGDTLRDALDPRMRGVK
jgi:peptide/nickel transport system permease protein